LIVSELLEHSSVREHESNIRKAFYPESLRDVWVLVRIHSDKYAALNKRPHFFIFAGRHSEGGKFLCGKEGAPNVQEVGRESRFQV
jgi:hypothetical protein